MKRFLFIFIFILFFIFLLFIRKDKNYVDHFNIKNNKIIKYDCYKKNIVIPDIGIEEIGDSAFENCGISNITLSSSIKKIGKKAFYNNSISSLVIPKSVLFIDDFAFMNNSISYLDYDNNIKMGNGVFNHNKLKDGFIIKNNSIISYGGNNKNIDIPNVLEISDYAFYGCELISINIPSSIKKIGSNSFSNNNLIELFIPGSINKINSNSFSNNNYLVDVYFEDKNMYNSLELDLGSSNIYFKKK